MSFGRLFNARRLGKTELAYTLAHFIDFDILYSSYDERKGFPKVCQFCKNEPVIGVVMHGESQYHVGLNCLQKEVWVWRNIEDFTTWKTVK